MRRAERFWLVLLRRMQRVEAGSLYMVDGS